jgi:transcriptional regulator
MHTPDEFKEKELANAHDLIEELRFSTLFTSQPQPDASHLPLLLDRDRGPKGTLVGHLAKRNLQCDAIGAAETVLVCFLGPSTYISPSWYGTQPRVPTWNYVAVHAHCRPTMVFEPDALRNMVMRLSRTMERADTTWRADAAYVDSMLGEIVGFELEIIELQAQVRLSQQNSPDDRTRVLAALSHGTLAQRQVAEFVERYPPRSGDTTCA